MGGLLASKAKPVQQPPVPPPPPIPDVGPEVKEQAARKRPSSRRETFLTGDLIPINEKLKKRKLGGGVNGRI